MVLELWKSSDFPLLFILCQILSFFTYLSIRAQEICQGKLQLSKMKSFICSWTMNSSISSHSKMYVNISTNERYNQNTNSGYCLGMKLKEFLFSSLCFLELAKFSTILSCHFCDNKQSYTIHHFLKVKSKRKHFGNHF